MLFSCMVSQSSSSSRPVYTPLNTFFLISILLFSTSYSLVYAIDQSSSSSQVNAIAARQNAIDGTFTIPLKTRRSILEDVGNVLASSISSSNDKDANDDGTLLKPIRLANLDRLLEIKIRVASKWSTLLQANAMERANRRSIIPASSDTRFKIKHITKRADPGSNDSSEVAPSSPSLAPTRGGSSGQGPASVPLTDDIIAGEDIEVSRAVI